MPEDRRIVDGIHRVLCRVDRCIQARIGSPHGHAPSQLLHGSQGAIEIAAAVDTGDFHHPINGRGLRLQTGHAEAHGVGAASAANELRDPCLLAGIARVQFAGRAASRHRPARGALR